MNATPNNEAYGALVLAAAFARELDGPISELAASLRAARGINLQGEIALTDRLGTIIRGLAEVASPTAPAIDAVDVHEAIELALQLTWTQVSSRACLMRHYRPLPLVRGQMATLARAVIALLHNAAEAIPDVIPGANEIRIETEARSDGRVVIDISDTGIGIAYEDLDRIFDPFFTTKSASAAGLGLTAARTAVQRLGGTLKVESRVGQGSRFRITLPAADSTTRAALPVSHMEALPLRRVLVVGETLAAAHALGVPLAAEETCITYAKCDDALERLGLGEPFELVVWSARSWFTDGYRERLAQVAPDALLRTFAWSVRSGATGRVEAAAQ